MSHVETWRKSIPGGGNSQCRDPEQKCACHVRGTLGSQCAGLGAWRGDGHRAGSHQALLVTGRSGSRKTFVGL